MPFGRSVKLPAPSRSDQWSVPFGLLGHAWATGGLGEGVETVGGLVVEAVHELPVAVHGHNDGGVAEAGLDDLGVLSGGDEPGGVGVAKVVYPARAAHRLGDCSPSDPASPLFFYASRASMWLIMIMRVRRW